MIAYFSHLAMRTLEVLSKGLLLPLLFVLISTFFLVRTRGVHQGGCLPIYVYLSLCPKNNTKKSIFWFSDSLCSSDTSIKRPCLFWDILLPPGYVFQHVPQQITKTGRAAFRCRWSAVKELLSGDQSRDSRHFDFRYSIDKQLPPKGREVGNLSQPSVLLRSPNLSVSYRCYRQVDKTYRL